MSYQTLVSELTGSLPGLPFPLAQIHINRAWDDIRRERIWSFLIGETAYTFPTQIVAGTVTITQFSTSVTLDATATTALTGLSNPLITARQFRVNGGQVYNVVSLVGSNLVVDRAIQEPTAAGQPYQVYQCYIAPPTTDFLKWDSFDDFQNGYSITGGRLSVSRTSFDLRDPQRQSQGLAYFVGQYKSDAVGGPLYELWPHPVQGQSFNVTYRRQGVAFTTPASVQPLIISDTLLVLRALVFHAYPWAEANKGNFPALAKTNFLSLIRDRRAEYITELGKIKRQDDEVLLQRVYNRGRRMRCNELPGPADAKYWQSHPIMW